MKKALYLGIFLFVFFSLPKISSAATLYMSPASGSFSVGSTITVNVRTNTQGAAVNTAEISVSFSTDTLELISVKQGSSFYLPAPGSPSKTGSTAYFGGGVPTPGYNGNAGNVGVLTFRAKAQGEATVSVSSGKVLLNDGLGTNALTSSSGARFTISPPAVGTPQVSSSTHPDPVRWYNGHKVDLSWTRPSGAHGFSFEFDQKENTNPDSELDTTVTTTKSYENVADGIWYFHIKARRQDAGSGFGAVEHFQVNIDSKAPAAFEIKKTEPGPTATESTKPEITFVTTDDGSGIVKYDLFINGELSKENITSPATLDGLKSGENDVKVVAYDSAGNATSSEIKLTVSKAQAETVGFFERTVTVPLYIISIFFVLLLLILALLVMLLLKRGKRVVDASGNYDIVQMQDAIDESLENLKSEISQKLIGLSARSSEELYDKEAAVVKQIRTGIGKTRKNIDKKIGKLKRR